MKDEFWAITQYLETDTPGGLPTAFDGFCTGVAAAIAWSKNQQPSLGTLRLLGLLSDVAECHEYFRRQTEGNDASSK